MARWRRSAYGRPGSGSMPSRQSEGDEGRQDGGDEGRQDGGDEGRQHDRKRSREYRMCEHLDVRQQQREDAMQRRFAAWPSSGHRGADRSARHEADQRGGDEQAHDHPLVRRQLVEAAHGPGRPEEILHAPAQPAHCADGLCGHAPWQVGRQPGPVRRSLLFLVTGMPTPRSASSPDDTVKCLLGSPLRSRDHRPVHRNFMRRAAVRC